MAWSARNDVRARVSGVGIPLRSLRSASPFAERKGRFLGCARNDRVGIGMAARGDRNDVRARVYGVGIPLRSLRSASPFAERKGSLDSSLHSE